MFSNVINVTAGVRSGTRDGSSIAVDLGRTVEEHMAVVKQLAQNLHEEVTSELQ
jgi:hypothetical protein